MDINDLFQGIMKAINQMGAGDNKDMYERSGGFATKKRGLFERLSN